MVDHINNGEEGYSVRGKLNEVIDRTNTLNGIENQVESNKNLSQQNKAAIEKEVQDRKDADAALQAEIDKKADSDHKHEIADIEDLQDILDNKQESGDYVTEAPDDGYQYARQFIVDDPDGEGVMTWTVVRTGGGSGGAGAGMVIRATPPDPDDRVVGMQWLNELNGEVWIWDGTRWLEFPAEGGLHKGGGGGVPFPADELRTGQWLAYRQVDEVYDPIDGTLVSEGVYEWGVLTTDTVITNGDFADPDARFKFARWGEDLAGLDNQLKVNRFIYDKLLEVEERAVNFGFVEVPDGAKTLRHDANLLSHGGPVTNDDCLILHLDPVDCTTTPCQKLVFVCPEGQEVIDHFNATQQEAIFKVIQLDPAIQGSTLAQTMRGIDGGSMSGDVYTIECDQVYGDTLIDGVDCQLLVRTSSAITAEWVENNFVHRRGGDSMEGPLVIKAQDVTDARATKKIEALGMYSGSDSSALRLGVGHSSDRIYVGQNDTSFNQPIKVSEITERHNGEGIAIDHSLIFAPRGHEIMQIRPQDGAAHTVTMFSTGASNGTKLDLKLYGNTYKNALRIFAKSSAASEIANISSDGGISLSTTLDMNNNTIKDLADPAQDQDAVNKRTLTQAIDAIPEADLSGIESRLDGHDQDIALLNDRVNNIDTQLNGLGTWERVTALFPQAAGQFSSVTGGGQSSGTVADIRKITITGRSAEGQDIDLMQFQSGKEIRFLDAAGHIYSFEITGFYNFYPGEAGGYDVRGFWVAAGGHTGGKTEMAPNESLTMLVEGYSPELTTATLALANPSDTRILTGVETQADANKVIAETLDKLVDDDLNPIGGGGGAEASPTHTIMGKGMWGKSIDELATDKFVAFDYQGNTRNYLDNYVMGIAVASRFGNELTEGLEWKQGAYVEVYDSDGKLRFAKEIDSVEHDAKGYLRLHWEWLPTMYTSNSSLSYGDQLMLKVTGLTGDVSQSFEVQDLSPPEGDPHIGE